jgi:hypothetical protein
MPTQEERLSALEKHLEDGFASQENKLDQVLLLLNSLTTKPDQEAE